MQNDTATTEVRTFADLKRIDPDAWWKRYLEFTPHHFVPCTSCRGLKLIPCTRCEGPRPAEHCDGCHGDGMELCGDCDGRGTEIVFDEILGE